MNRVTGILIGVILIMAVGWFLTIRSCNNQKHSFNGNVSLTKELKPGADSASYYKSRNGELVSANKSLTVTVNDLKADSNDLTTQLSNMKIKASKLTDYLRTVSHIKDTVHDTIPFHDTVRYNHPVEWKDITKWDAVYGISYPDKVIITQKSFVDSLYTAFKTDGTVDILNKNPYAKTTNILNLKIYKPEKKFHFSIQGGYYITPKGLQPGIGAGIGYTVW